MSYDNEKHDGYCDARQRCDGTSVDEVRDLLKRHDQRIANQHDRYRAHGNFNPPANGYEDGYREGLLAELPATKRIRVFTREIHDVVYELDVPQGYDVATSDDDYPWDTTHVVSDDIDETIVEGIIMDARKDDECIGTDGRTFDEWFDYVLGR